MAELKRISQLVYQHSGIVLGEHKRDMVQSRLQKRLRILKISTISDYLHFIEQDASNAEIPELINALTTNLTSFFREKHHFDHVKTHVMQPVLEANKRLRIWSAGCSVGAEPYSLAMVLYDVLQNLPNKSHADAKILATDVDSNVLAKAASGIYESEWIQKIPESYLNLHCRALDDKGEQWSMSEHLKKLITFKQLNLLSNWPMKGKFDAIFCRNVIIYFDKETQSKLFERYANQLVEGGLLYIGHSETLHNLSTRFESIARTTYRKVR
jgi:chemotaxis protein methyltransferase CheR